MCNICHSEMYLEDRIVYDRKLMIIIVFFRILYIPMLILYLLFLIELFGIFLITFIIPNNIKGIQIESIFPLRYLGIFVNFIIGCPYMAIIFYFHRRLKQFAERSFKNSNKRIGNEKVFDPTDPDFE
jgi:hypothetical protein